jgi:UDP-GlcNAc:undecaprenyl-phosphate GlcNAc-1-phosphate transferase
MAWIYLISGILALGICVFANPLGRLLGVIDRPDGQRKLHAGATPLTGGFSIIVPLVISVCLIAISSDYARFFWALAIATSAVLFVGLIDDRRSIRPVMRLILSAVICYCLIFAVPSTSVTFLNFSFLESPLFLSNTWAIIFTLLCLVGLQNAVNMADGKNGLVIGMSLIWVMLIMAYAPEHLMPVLVVFAIGLAITLYFNVTGRLFLGDSGSYSLSIAVGVLTIYVYQVNFVSLHADVIALWFLVPILDCLRLMAMRMMQGRSPFTPDRNHLHHMLLGLMRWRWALATYLSLVGGPSLLAYLMPQWTLLWAAMVLSIYSLIVATRGRGLAQRGLTPL